MSINIYIIPLKVNDSNRRSLFILTRPFITTDYKWENDYMTFERWGISTLDYKLVNDLTRANLVLIPCPINEYFLSSRNKELNALNQICQDLNIKAYGYISGDFGENFREFSNIIYFRMGGFRSQLNSNNKGFPVIIGDKFLTNEFIPTMKNQMPIIGFCGHSTLSIKKKILENLKFYRENVRRFFVNPGRKDYEPRFASAFERAKILKYIEQSDLIEKNFIQRKRYRAGAKDITSRDITTQQYFENISNSDYVLCIRGAGNFSVRLYETLMMGKIPIFINTDCLMPFENNINWRQHVIWIEWSDRKNIVQSVIDFHNSLDINSFMALQISNRKLWKEKLSINEMLENVCHDL